MTSTPTPPLLGDCDDPAAVLSYARGRKAEEEQAARDVMVAAAKYASMNTVDALVGPIHEWHERALPLGGEGCPEIAEFAVAEFAAGMGRSPESGRRYLAESVEGLYRLPQVWEQLLARRVPAWREQMIARVTTSLSRAAAEFVDAHVAPVAHKVGPAQLMRLVEEARARFDPERAEAERLAAAEARKFDIALAEVGVDGVVRTDGGLDLADALDLETAVADLAHQLLVAGCTESLDVRRSMALGFLARGESPIPEETEDADGSGKRPERRRVVLHVHISEAAVLGAGGLARLHETRGAVTAEQVRLWCSDAQVVVKPVLDLDQHQHVECYEIPDRLKQQASLRDTTCIHPAAPAAVAATATTAPATPADPPAPATSHLADHTTATTGCWSYVTVEPGVYLWRSPLGYQYLRDATGTVDVTPDEDRRRASVRATRAPR